MSIHSQSFFQRLCGEIPFTGIAGPKRIRQGQQFI
jgi:hypothetical protein